jgi:hypothetical protein
MLCIAVRRRLKPPTGFNRRTRRALAPARSLPLPATEGFTRQGLLDYFDNCWALTEVLFACLQGADAFVRQPYHQLRHPMIFYYGAGGGGEGGDGGG